MVHILGNTGGRGINFLVNDRESEFFVQIEYKPFIFEELGLSSS